MTRAVGYKRGPVMLAIVFGVLLGTALGALAQVASFFGSTPVAEPLLPILLQAYLPAALVNGGAACFGAYQRLH